MNRELRPNPARKVRLTIEQRGLLYRRTIGFLLEGTHRSIEHVLQEAYLQGMRDAFDVMEAA